MLLLLQFVSLELDEAMIISTLLKLVILIFALMNLYHNDLSSPKSLHHLFEVSS